MIHKILLVLFTIPTYAVAVELDFNVPADVSVFIERRDLCDHFRGEPVYNEERKKFLLKNMIELCTGSDLKLSNLKSKYKSNKTIIKLLSTYEDDIEPN